MRCAIPLTAGVVLNLLLTTFGRTARAQGADAGVGFSTPPDAVLPSPVENTPDSVSAPPGDTTADAGASTGHGESRPPEGTAAPAPVGKEPAPSGTGDVTMNVGSVDVVVAGRRPRSIDLPGSVDIIGEKQISKETTTNALDLMRRIPGFAYQDYGNGGVPNGFMMRGFSSNHGSDTLVVVDGIPINDHFWQADGAPDLNQITAEEIERIEVIKGPLDARYGNWARSGIIQIHTRTRGDFWRATASRGSYNTNKGYVSFGSEHLDGKFNQVYSAEFFDTDGWRRNSAQQRQNAYGKWFYRPAKDVRVGLMVHAYKAGWSTGGYITEEQWKRDPRSAFSGSANDGGNKAVLESSLHVDWKLARDLSLQGKLWRRASDASRYADWTDEGRGQTESYSNEKVTGGLVDVDGQWSLPADQVLRLQGGVDYRYFDSHPEDWSTQARVRQVLNANHHYGFQNGGLYLKASHDIAKRVRLFGGIREDLFWGDATDRMTDAKSTMKTYSVPTYKGGIVVNALDQLSLYGNIGTTFRLPQAEVKYDANPPEVTGLLFWEAGLKARPIDGLRLRYALFQSGERLTRFVEGQYLDDGKARRTGHEVELSLGPWQNIELFTSVTVHDARYDGGQNDGKHVPTVPRYIWKVGVQGETEWGTGGRVQYQDVGKWDTDPENQHSYEGYRVVDLSLFQVLAQRWSAALDIKNLFDLNYAEFVSFWSNSNQYMSSNPRTVFASLRYSME